MAYIRWTPQGFEIINSIEEKPMFFWQSDRALLEELKKNQTTILALLAEMGKGELVMSQAMDDLVLAVEKNNQVDQSAVQAIQGVAAQIAALKDQIVNLNPEDAEKITALAATVNASADALAAAIVTIPA